MRILFVFIAALALVACPASKDSGSNPKPAKPSLAERGLTAEVSAVSLADDCAASRADLVAAEDCATGVDCSPLCQQTSMQMSFGSDGPTEAVAVKVLEVRLFAKKTGDLVDTLSARDPARWVENAYQSWDEQLPPNADTKVKYDLSAPNWAEFDQSFDRLFYLEVDVEIDGTVITIKSGELSREPQIVT